MALVLLALCLLLVVPCTKVMGTEFIGSPNIDHWQRVLDRELPKDCVGAVAGDKITDLHNCHNFFMCTGVDDKPLPNSLPCGDKFLCFSDSGDCSVDPTECTDPGKPCADEPPACNSICDGHIGRIVYNKDDCSKFSVCLENDDHLPFNCKDGDEGLYFNGHKCVNDVSACCNCQPDVCDNKGGLIPDPIDCHAFYACVNLDGNSDDLLTAVGPNLCKEGQLFNATSSLCEDENAACEKSCKAGDGGGTSPTSISTTSTSISSTTASASTSSTTTSNPTTPASTSTSNPTTPASTSTNPTTVRTSTTDDGCIDLVDFQCTAHGNYAHCTFCDPSYIHCDNAASSPTLGYCLEGKVYNTNPEYPGCILPKNCPFP